MVLVARTQVTQPVPWSLLIETDNGEGYRLKVGVGELALIVAEKRDTDSILIWHDGMDWLIRKDCDGYSIGLRPLIVIPGLRVHRLA
jgi:hypothetical protein